MFASEVEEIVKKERTLNNMEQSMKFIYLTGSDGQTVVVINAEKITYMLGTARGAVIYIDEGTRTAQVHVKESPDKIYGQLNNLRN